MNTKKEEILEKSRRSKHDEGLEAATNKGSRLADYTVGIFGTVMMSVALFFNEFAAAFAVFIVIAAYSAGLHFTLFRFSKKKFDMLLSFLSAAMIIVFFVLFLAATNGWWIF
jgi:hypothetical protein